MRVATDIGGTFTDLVFASDQGGDLGLAKASTTPPNFEVGVLDALDRAGISPEASVTAFVHGSTLVINALTERTGSVTALVTTKGFRDVLEIGRANRPDLYNVRFRKPRPIVPRSLRFEVTERVDYRGTEIVPLDEREVESAGKAAWEAGARAVAVCFLHSYANPDHEARCAEILREQFPDMAITMSHDVTREWREYERSSSAVLNAYVQHAVGDYLERLEAGLAHKGVKRGLFIMQSNGGMMTFRRARDSPITMVESGPVGGVIGAAWLGEHRGQTNVISMDIGGTTAKSSLIRKGEIPITTEYRIEQSPVFPGYPMKVPVVDIVEIGAGGGSIAGFDDAGRLRVGPRSAGAVPGPACYPSGGVEPTVTDANLLAGRINPDYFLGGEIKVSLDRARTAMEKVARPLDISVDDAALGVIRLVNANMVNAIKLVSVRRGHDPRDFDLVAFGGGGSMHAGALALALRIPRVVIPPAPGHFSAVGMLLTDVRRDLVLTRLFRAGEASASGLNEIWAELEEAAERYFRSEIGDSAQLIFVRSVEMRYKGQEHTVRVSMANGVLGKEDLAAVESAFHAQHELHYTFRLDADVEYVTFHLAAASPVAKPALPRPPRVEGSYERARKPSRVVRFDEVGERTAATFERALLSPGDEIEGPSIIEEAAASTVVFPDQHAIIDEWGCIVIHTES